MVTRAQAKRLSDEMNSNSPNPDVDRRLGDEINFEDLVIGKKIGEGSFGEVHEGVLWGHNVAIKQLKLNSKHLVEEFKNEITIMRALRHPNIVEFMGMAAQYQDGAKDLTGAILYIVTELCMCSLDKFIGKEDLSWKRYFRFAKDMVKGVVWLHHKGIIHRDLKPNNMLVTDDMKLKIADFGISHIQQSPLAAGGSYGVAGTPIYMAPEVIQNEHYDLKADIFSIGVVLCEMLDGRYPFKTIVKNNKTEGFEKAIIEGSRPRIPRRCPKSLKSLIERCWAHDATMRPSSDEVLAEIETIEKEMENQVNEVLDDLEDMPEEVRVALEEERNLLREARQYIEELKQDVEELQAQLNETTEKKQLHKRRASNSKLDDDLVDLEVGQAKRVRFMRNRN